LIREIKDNIRLSAKNSAELIPDRFLRKISFVAARIKKANLLIHSR